jgi:hypothetical protein
MKKPIKIIFITFFFCIVGCGGKEILKPTPQKNLLVFVDLSTSLDTLETKSQSKKLSSLIDTLSIYNTEIKIFPMDLSVYQDPIISHKIEEKYIHELKNVKIRQDRKEFAKKLEAILFEIYSEKSRSKKDIKSCIISSLEMAYNSLPEDTILLKNTQLLFMTDRIEQCPESSAGKLYMCNSSREPNFDKIINQIEEKYNPKNKLGNKLKSEQIHFIITSTYSNTNICLSENQQIEIWDKVLIKHGFTKPNRVYQKTSMPTILW